MSTFIAIAALTVSFFAFIIAALTFLVNRDKVRLELFEKRFNIYLHIMKYALLFAHHEYMSLEKSEYKIIFNNAIEVFRQSKFLFKKNDKIYDFIYEILQTASTIKAQFDKDITREKNSDNYIEPISLEGDLKILEELLMPYLYFGSFKKLNLPARLKKLKFIFECHCCCCRK